MFFELIIFNYFFEVMELFKKQFVVFSSNLKMLLLNFIGVSTVHKNDLKLTRAVLRKQFLCAKGQKKPRPKTKALCRS